MVAAKYRAGVEVLTVVYRRLPAVRGVPEKRAATARGGASPKRYDASCLSSSARCNVTSSRLRHIMDVR